MTDIQIAVLEIAMVGGTGLLIGIIGIAVWFAQKRKTARCTEKTEGQVIRHRFRGGGRMEPVIGYRADGREYETVRTFRGVMTKNKSDAPKCICRSGRLCFRKRLARSSHVGGHQPEKDG